MTATVAAGRYGPIDKKVLIGGSKTMRPCVHCLEKVAPAIG
jgi:hypothetical protein